jgi:dethiobiotin synthase
MAYRLSGRQEGYDMISFPEKFFITGTDTDIGKTYISAMLMSALDATYWKPVQAGIEEETDTEFVQRVSEADDSRIIEETYRLKTPMSPHGAADIDGVSISLNDFELPQFSTEHLIVEGAGGLIVPLNWKETVLDMIKKFDLPVLLVARSALGTLNHTLLSVEALRNRGIDVFAIVLNGEKNPHNKKTLEHFTQIPVLESEPNEDINRDSLIAQFKQVTNHK